MARQVPLAANAASARVIGGASSMGTRFQLAPPSSVTRMNKRPSMGSPMAMPWRASQNDSASRKTPFSVVSNTLFHERPSVVRNILASPRSASPALIATASFALRASMSRRSRESAPGIESMRHVSPPSVVRAMRPAVPLAHTTVGLTTKSPRNSASVVERWSVHCAFAEPTQTIAPAAANLSMREVICLLPCCLPSVGGRRQCSSPPKRRGDDTIEADQCNALEPDGFPVVDDDRRRQCREQQRRDEQRRKRQRQHRPSQYER